MSILEAAHATLLQEGYRPGPLQGSELPFRYYGQDAWIRIRPLGPGTVLGELECRLPRPAPTAAQVDAFGAAHPLSRLSAHGDQARLQLESLVTVYDAPGQFQALLALLDRYAADAVFQTGSPGLTREEPAVVVETEPRPAPPQVQEQVKVPVVTPPASSSTGPATEQDPAAPDGWEDVWGMLSPRFHPLAQALAALRVPVPDEVHMDMMQGRQVRGTAIMMWGEAPGAVVVCEPGQLVPAGYQGSTWFKHLTVERVAEETRAHLQAAGRL